MLGTWGFICWSEVLNLKLAKMISSFLGIGFCQVSPTDFGSAAASFGSGRTAEAGYQTEQRVGNYF